MRKDKISMSIVICIVCIILVAVMYAQFKTVEQTDITGIENAREDELRTLVSTWKTKYEEANEQITATRQIIKDYREKMEKNEETSELLEKELQQTNLLLGKTNVIGDGVTVILSDNEDRSIEASDLLDLINELRTAGAEAISINEKRVITTTEIVDVGGIMINEERTVSPYVVKAIGDQKYLSSALSLKISGYVDKYNNLGKSVNLSLDKNIKISAYNENSRKGQMKMKYAQEVE